MRLDHNVKMNHKWYIKGKKKFNLYVCVSFARLKSAVGTYDLQLHPVDNLQKQNPAVPELTQSTKDRFSLGS